jgi:hypothetical protein
MSQIAALDAVLPGRCLQENVELHESDASALDYKYHIVVVNVEKIASPHFRFRGGANKT